ncbi:MAG: GHKL domain-containing protein [Pyramidobacter sp.]|nr:GHKL domain-containing protein [Pyramidobacter sp.]
METYVRYVLELAAIIPETLFLYLPVLGKLRFSRRAVFTAHAILLPAWIATAAWLCAQSRFLVIRALVISFVVFFAVFCGCVRIDFRRRLFCLCNAVMLASFSLLYAIFVTARYEAANAQWADARLLSLPGACVGLALTVVVGAVFWHALTVELPLLLGDPRLDGLWKILWLAPAVVVALIRWYVPIYPHYILVGRGRSFILIAIPLLLVAVHMLYTVLWWTAVRLAESARLQQENTLLQLESKRYEELRSYMESTRALRHDFRQHLLVISDLARAGQLEQLREYLLPLAEEAGRAHSSYCANRAVDAVVSHYAAVAKERETRVECELRLPPRLPVKEADFCAILGNLLENALAAVAPLPQAQRRVSVIASMLSDEMIGLAVDNPYSGTIPFGENGLPRAERPGHGIGLASVQSAVRRYDGTMTVSAEKGVFSVEIIMYAERAAQRTP